MFNNFEQFDKPQDYSDYNFIRQQDSQHTNESSSNQNISSIDQYDSIFDPKRYSDSESNIKKDCTIDNYFSNNSNQTVNTQSNKFYDCSQDIQIIQHQMKNSLKNQNSENVIAKKIKKAQKQRVYRERENNTINILQKEVCFYYQILEYLLKNNIDQRLQTLQQIDIIQEEYQNYFDKYTAQQISKPVKKKYTKHKFQNREEYQQDLKKRNNQTALASRQKKLDKIEQIKQLRQKFLELIINIPIQMVYQFQETQDHKLCICQQTPINFDNNDSKSTENLEQEKQQEKEIIQLTADQLQDQLKQIMQPNLFTKPQVEDILSPNTKLNNSNQKIQVEQFDFSDLINEHTGTSSTSSDQQQYQQEKETDKQKIINNSNNQYGNSKLYLSGMLLILGIILLIELVSGGSLLSNTELIINEVMNFFKNLSPKQNQQYTKDLLEYQQKKHIWNTQQCNTAHIRYEQAMDDYSFCIENFKDQVEILQNIGDLETIENFNIGQMETFIGDNLRVLEKNEDRHFNPVMIRGTASLYSGHAQQCYEFYSQILEEKVHYQENDKFLVDYHIIKCLYECERTDKECFLQQLKEIEYHMERAISNCWFFKTYIKDFLYSILFYEFDYKLEDTLKDVQALLSPYENGLHQFQVVQYSSIIQLEIYLKIRLYKDYKYCTEVLQDYYILQQELMIPTSASVQQIYRTYQMCSYKRLLNEIESPTNEQLLLIKKLSPYKNYDNFMNQDIEIDDKQDIQNGMIYYFN